MIAKPKDFCMAVLLLIMVALLYARSNVINVGVEHALGPMFFPRLVLSGIGGLSLILLVQSLRRTAGQPRSGASGPRVERRERILQWSFVGLFLLYLIILPVLGYIWTTLGFLVAGMALLGPRKPRNLALYAGVAVVVTFGLQYVFSGLLHLFLP